jgi:multicomponent Na+:H+ antiporter subunit B
MMTSLILRTATRLLIVLMVLFSIFLMLRGHNEPGGGFIGGLVGAGAFALYAISYGVADARYAIRIDPRSMIGYGLGFALLAGFLAMFPGDAFLTGQWLFFYVGETEVELGTALLFDIGVYLVVVGATLTIIFSLEEENI